jgi:hypothetical protein
MKAVLTTGRRCRRSGPPARLMATIPSIELFFKDLATVRPQILARLCLGNRTVPVPVSSPILQVRIFGPGWILTVRIARSSGPQAESREAAGAPMGEQLAWPAGRHGLFAMVGHLILDPGFLSCQRRVLALARQTTTGRSFATIFLAQRGTGTFTAIRFRNVAGIEAVAVYLQPGKSKWKFPDKGQTI